MNKLKSLFIFFIAFFIIFSAENVSAQSERGKGFTIKKGDCIGILAPSAYLKGLAESENFKRAVNFFQSRGYRVKIAPSCSLIDRKYFSGTAEQRAEDINNFFADDEVKAILCTRGGYGAAQVLDKLNYEIISQNSKPLIGYSDITALHIALGEKSGIVTIHAPMLFNFSNEKKMTSYTKAKFLNGITNKNPIGEFSLPYGVKLKTLVKGDAEGIIIGGNLTVLTSLVGTPYELDGTGALLFLEDVGEEPYRLDRMLNQLYQSGLLNRVNGIIFGDFTDCENDNANGLQLENVLEHYAKISGKPTIIGFPAGHGKNNAFLPFGVHASMKAYENGKVKIFIDESAFKA